ncbi:UDP-2,3-diacetamido-2,3-dideoxy-D-glucuronate 2-epimerase [bacterium HR33]|nr:UDP-2,3-diacetamido-2,3-dideoxy-D-glucuronate 2-epimerase [bacterium HR33]
MKIVHVVGARPNFVKISPIIRELNKHSDVVQKLVHTGQHYDETLSRVFFEELDIPTPDIELGVGSASQAVQTARIMMAFEPVCVEWKPDIVVVVGDVNSTVACALVAAKLGVRVAHVEAGLRSFDWSMPEEINRVVTDRLSDLLFTTERSANENLLREGIPPERIHFVGNVMIDTLFRYLPRARQRQLHCRLGLTPRRYAVVTLHRPSNVDSKAALELLLHAIQGIASQVPVVFPIHPRTRRRLEEFGIQSLPRSIRCVEPLGYLDFLSLLDQAGVVLTDSGGVQEETTALGVPCLTLRPNTERPVTVAEGTNRLVALAPEAIKEAVRSALALWENGSGPCQRLPELWDGRAAERIARVLVNCGG